MSDHYEVLGISRDASQEDVKRAYRRLARRFHPDANPGDPEAEERFKEIGRAHEVLSDPDKRARYDAFGDERAGIGGMGPDFGGISDLFSTFFGGMQDRPRTGPRRGADILAEVRLTLEEAATGVEREVRVRSLTTCSDCSGSGAAPGTSPERCTICGGTGETREVRRSIFGNVMTASTCSRCGGSGQTITEPCSTCRGQGRVEVEESMSVRIPAGIDDGAQLRVGGRGQAGMRGGTSGDLYVAITVDPHPVFQRGGDDLGCEVEVPMTVAALGGQVEIPTLAGSDTHDVSAGTQSGEVVRLKNRGMPRVDGRGHGDLVVLLRVVIPTDLNEEQAILLKKLADARGEEISEKGLFDRIKQAFR